MEIIIEEISRGQKLLGRHKFAKSSVTIGRGYHSDIIVSDPHVCAEHLDITFNGDNWIVNDIDSINGSFLGEGKQPANGHIIRSGDVITIGKSQIRVVFPHHPVAESITLSPFESLINLAKHPLLLGANILIFASIVGWVFFLNSTKEINFTQLLVPAVGFTLMLTIWPLIVSLISHLLKNEPRILTQIGISFFLLNITWLTGLLESFIDFNSSSDQIFRHITFIFPVIIAFSLFWLNCYVGFHMTVKRRLFVAAALTTLLIGGNTLLKFSKKPKFDEIPRFDNTLMTPHFLITPSSSVEEFVDNSDKLFNKVKEAAKKK